MGKPAARALVDKSAHTGPIQSGSPNVVIGGFPAARKGDPIGCSEHGSGIIVGGSGSVLVNGLPLARLGDNTQCNPPGSPATPASVAAPPQYWGASLAKKAGEDGTLTGALFDARVLGLYASKEDKAGDGRYNTASLGFAVEDLTMGNMKSDDLFRGELRNKIAVANATGTLYDGNSDIHGLNANATGTGVQYGGTAAAGKQGTLYGSVIGDVTIGTAEAKAVLERYNGSKGRYGFSVEGGAEAAAVKGEVTGNVDLYGVIVADAKVGGSLGAIGASAGLSAFLDGSDDSANLRITGELAIVLGLKGDASIKIAYRPIHDLFFSKRQEMSKSIDGKDKGNGSIMNGCVTVLVGD